VVPSTSPPLVFSPCSPLPHAADFFFFVIEFQSIFCSIQATTDPFVRILRYVLSLRSCSFPSASCRLPLFWRPEYPAPPGKSSDIRYRPRTLPFWEEYRCSFPSPPCPCHSGCGFISCFHLFGFFLIFFFFFFSPIHGQGPTPPFSFFDPLFPRPQSVGGPSLILLLSSSFTFVSLPPLSSPSPQRAIKCPRYTPVFFLSEGPFFSRSYFGFFVSFVPALFFFSPPRK